LTIKKHWVSKALKTIALIVLGLIVLLAVTVGIGKFVNYERHKIRSETGVQKAEYLLLGGIEQYIQTRGENRDNPVMLILHGGPGSNIAYFSYYWQTPLEEDYTLVHWDQRGSGNTYFRDKDAEPPTLELLLSDLDELVNYLRNEYGQEKIILMGHSWGTVLGGIYAAEHPEKLSRYVAVGQLADAWAGEEAAAAEAVRLALAAGKPEAAEEISKTLQSVESAEPYDLPAFMAYRALAGKQLPHGDAMSTLELIGMGLFSPDMTLSDLRWYFMALTDPAGYAAPNSALFEALFTGEGLSMYDYVERIEVPVTALSGDCDWITPYPLAEQFFADVSPGTALIYIKNTGHSPFLDKPQAFAEALLTALTQG
jgi:pimeloyl-ACP methyl ester carboxylesterase